MSTAETLSPEVTRYTGTPAPEATHWGIWRIDPRGKELRLRVMSPEGVEAELWPLSELTLDEVRNRWGGGEYKCFWMTEDPDNPQPAMRRRSAGRGRNFTVAGDAKNVYQVPHAAAPPAAPGSTFGEFERAVTMMGLVQQMVNNNRGPAIVPDERNVDLAKQVAKLEATIEGDRRLRETEERLNKEIRKLEDDLRDERGRRRRAEESAENGSALTLRDGEGVWDLVKKHVAANPGAALKQLGDVFRGMPMLVGLVQDAIKASQAAAPAPVVNPAPVARPRAVPTHLRAVPDPTPAPTPSPVTVPSVAPVDLGKLAAEEGTPRTPVAP
jgi:hypothetical protein